MRLVKEYLGLGVKAFQAEAIARAKVQEQKHLWEVQRTSRPAWLEGQERGSLVTVGGGVAYEASG